MQKIKEPKRNKRWKYTVDDWKGATKVLDFGVVQKRYCENQIKSNPKKQEKKQNTKNKSDEQIYLVNLLTEPNIHNLFDKRANGDRARSFASNKQKKKKTHLNECFINKTSWIFDVSQLKCVCNVTSSSRHTVIRRKMNVDICASVCVRVFVTNRVYKYYGIVCVLYACCSHHLQLHQCRALQHCFVLCSAVCMVSHLLSVSRCTVGCLWHRMQIKSVICITFDVGSFTIDAMPRKTRIFINYLPLDILNIVWMRACMRKKFIRTLRAIHLHTFPSSNWFNGTHTVHVLCCGI